MPGAALLFFPVLTWAPPSRHGDQGSVRGMARAGVGTARGAGLACSAASGRKSWYPGVEGPAYLEGKVGDYGWDPLGLGKDPVAFAWYRQAELQHARWAMLGCFGVLVQENVFPDMFWYNAALPENLPGAPYLPEGVNLAALLGIQFLLMHYVEVRRWQDYKQPGSVNQDPIFKDYSVPNAEVGYPGGGFFDPLGFTRDSLQGQPGTSASFKTLQLKELKNGRLAMVSFAGFTLQAQVTGNGPQQNLLDHFSDPSNQTIVQNFVGGCKIPDHSTVYGIDIPLTCLWPYNQ